jgi:hypothetical protein
MLFDRGVINSGPLAALSLAGRLDLLPALFAEFWIPEQVFHEVVLAGVGRAGASALADARWRAVWRNAWPSSTKSGGGKSPTKFTVCQSKEPPACWSKRIDAGCLAMCAQPCWT